MPNDDCWTELRERCKALEQGSALETPVSSRQFRIEATFDDRITVRFLDSEEERTLRREQFDVLVDRLETTPLRVETLQPGVEPYVAVLTLVSDVVVDGDDVVFDPDDGTAGESPFLVSPAEARTAPDRLHDDALLLAEHLHRFDVSEPDELATTDLTDCYVISSDVQRGADRLRTTFRDELLDRLGPDQRLHGRFGTVTRATRERRSLRDEGAVFDALDAHDIPHEWVRGIDPTKVDVVLSVTDLEPDEVYDRSESVYVQKTGVDEGEKYELLAGIRDQLTDLEGTEGEELRDELTDIESRIEAALATG